MRSQDIALGVGVQSIPPAKRSLWGQGLARCSPRCVRSVGSRFFWECLTCWTASPTAHL